MDLTTFIQSLRDLNLSNERIFSYLSEAIEVTADVMLDKINAGKCTIEDAVPNGFNYVYRLAIEDITGGCNNG